MPFTAFELKTLSTLPRNFSTEIDFAIDADLPAVLCSTMSIS